MDRKLGAICRAVAVKVAEGQHREAKLDRPDVAEGEGWDLNLGPTGLVARSECKQLDVEGWWGWSLEQWYIFLHW